MSDREDDGDPPAGRLPDPQYPDPRPLRRMQAATAALIGLVGVITLLSDARPDEVRWGALVGLAALVAVVLVILRKRGGREDGERTR